MSYWKLGLWVGACTMVGAFLGALSVGAWNEYRDRLQLERDNEALATASAVIQKRFSSFGDGWISLMRVSRSSGAVAVCGSVDFEGVYSRRLVYSANALRVEAAEGWDGPFRALWHTLC